MLTLDAFIIAPGFCELYADVKINYEKIRKYARKMGRNFYSLGWMLDIARCIYTLLSAVIAVFAYAILRRLLVDWPLREPVSAAAGGLIVFLRVCFSIVRAGIEFYSRRRIFRLSLPPLRHRRNQCEYTKRRPAPLFSIWCIYAAFPPWLPKSAYFTNRIAWSMMRIKCRRRRLRDRGRGAR